VTLDLGKDVVTWGRKRDAGSGEESIRYCDEAHSNQPNCNKWVDEVGGLKDTFHFFLEEVHMKFSKISVFA